MSLPASNELTPEELDAMEQGFVPPAPAPDKPLAMGPVQQLDPVREYSPEEIDLFEQATEVTPDDLDEQLVTSVFDDPTYIPTREEFFTARDAKARLKAEGKLPGLLENAATGATGFIQTLADMGHEILDDPGDFLARSPATMLATARKSWRNTNDVARWIRSTNQQDPIGRDEQTGEFIFGQTGAGMSDADVLAARQQLAAEQGRKIRAVNEEDLKDYEYDFFLGERIRQKELEEWVASTTAPTEFVTRMLTGRNQEEQPMQATSDIAGGLVEATNVATMGVPLAAGAKTLGLSRLAMAEGSRTARVLEKAAQTGIEGMETGATRFQNLIQKTTRLTPETQTKIAKWSAAGGVGGAAFGMESQIPGVSQVQDAAKVIGGAYIGYKLGLGTLRTVQKVAGPTATILRVAADPADGLDPIAQASVATKLAAFPELSPVREVLENPTKFRSIESTPARLAADPRLGPQTRAVMEGLANPLVVQGVRGASAVAGGAIKGAAANTPFVALALNAEEEKAAAAMLGIGGAFGTAGAAINRIGGVRQRRAEARASDIGRMFMDVELAGGDVAGLAKTYSPQQLGDMAAMQGIFRNSVEFVPLNQADYDLNVQANGGAGSAGLFVQAPPGEKARVFVNLDARRNGIAPHEFGHALLSSGALGGAQAAEIRANVNRRYTQAGVEVRATEYARNLIAAQNEKAFPGQNLPISQDAINAKLDELGQSGLLRGDLDTLDWARDELFAEEFRTASANLDFAAIRRGMPADGSWLGSMEKVLGGHANALSISGVRIDPATGAPIDTPQSLFRDNPVLAADKPLLKNLDTYIRNYRQWVNHPEQTKPRGVRVAPTARPQDLANNPQITFHDLGNGVRGNDFATIDPATGQPMLRSQADINAETIKRQQQMRSLVGSKLLPATDPNLGPKKTADGRVTIRGRVLPQQFDFLNGFAQHIRGFGRQFEQHAARGESMQVRYHAIGSSDTGSFRIKNLGNLEAITREVIPWGWELTSKGNLMASMLDLTQFRNRALRAINQGDPQMQLLFGNDMAQVEGTLKQWMDNHRQDLPGDTKIGAQKRDAINALVGIATNINRNANPFSGKIGGPGSAIKQFRLDRVDTAAGTGRQGFHFDYDKANGNLLPEVATPLPDLSRDLPGQALPNVVENKMPVAKVLDVYERVKDPMAVKMGLDIDLFPGKREARIQVEFNNLKDVDKALALSDNEDAISLPEWINATIEAKIPGFKSSGWGYLSPEDIIDNKAMISVGEDVLAPQNIVSFSPDIGFMQAGPQGTKKIRESGDINSTPQGQAMPDAVPDKGVEMPQGSMTQLFNTAAKALPRTIPQAKSVPSVRVLIREKAFDKKGQPVLDKKGNQKIKVKPKLRDNTEVKFKPGDFELPLPNFQIAKSKFSIGNKDLYGTALNNKAQALSSISQIDQATSIIESDPLKFIDPKGYTEIMRDAGVTGNILVPPSGIAMMLNRPKDFIALLDGGFHGPRTISGTREAAMAGLDSVVEMRQVIGEKPTEFVTALHHLWGTLSKQLPPLDQEALWMRLVVNPEVIQQIQNSIDGKFSLEKDSWAEIVDNARESTQGRYEKLGNNATSNANSFHLMLENHNGKWSEVADLYSAKNAIEMRSRFNGLGHGATGIKNKVQGFIGLTFGIKGTVLDRWRFVDLYMDPVMQATGAPSHQHYFQYTGDAKRIPEDPIGIYANYGTIENENPAFSLALYNSIDRAAQAAINASPELKAYLGNHADPGGLHWVTWNAIKNEAVGHSSLDLTKNFLKQFGRTGTASDWVSFANSSKAYVEGQAANGREIIRLTLDKGVFNYSRQ